MVIDQNEARVIMRAFEKLYIQSLHGDPLSEDIRLLKNRILEYYPSIRKSPETA